MQRTPNAGPLQSRRSTLGCGPESDCDDVLEQVLRAQQLPHHVLVYHADGEWRGRFCHRTPDGRLRAIERPDNLLTLEPGLVLVKLNGGAVPGLVRG